MEVGIKVEMEFFICKKGKGRGTKGKRRWKGKKKEKRDLSFFVSHSLARLIARPH